MRKVPPTNDLMFKKLFGSEENKPILQGLIHDVWGYDIALDDIDIIHAYSIKAYEEALREELSGTDITPSREIVLHETLRDITVVCPVADFLQELQLRKDDHFDLRALYYTCQRFCDNYNVPGRMLQRPNGKPNRFSSLRPVKALNILGHLRFPDDQDAFRIFDLYDPAHGRSYPGQPLTIAAFELGKPHVTGVLQYWRQFFTGATVDSAAPSYIHEAEAKLDYLNLSRKEKTVIDLLEKAEARYDSELDTAWFGGRAEGHDEGYAEGVNDMISAMQNRGLDPATIALVVNDARGSQADTWTVSPR